MDTLYKDWLSCMNGGVRPVLSADTTRCFYRSLEAAYTMAFAPMLVETRGFKASPGGVEEYVPLWSLEDWNIDYDTNLQWSYGVNRWLKLSQMADYAKYCLSGYVDAGTGAFLNTINIWKGFGNSDESYTSLADDNCPMNQQWLPQAMRFGTKFTELSSLEGTDMQPWWSTSYNPTYFGDPSFDGLRYTVYNGPYLPSKMNRQWYCASWRALCKLINTPSIAIGGSQQGWRWINPLYRSTNSVCFNLSSFQNQAATNEFIPLSSFIDDFDAQVCGGTIRQDTLPWSVCGLIIGDAVYSSDDAAWTRGSVYFNLPILEPLDGMRAFFGAQQTFAQTHSSVYDMAYKLPQSFLNRHQFGTWTNILSTGTDVEHWSGSNPSGVWPEYSFVSKPYRNSSNGLTEVALQNNLTGNICTPPLRLVAENVFAHQWLWNSFLFGTKTDQWTDKLNYTYAWSPLRFTRDHYFRDYSFNVAGEAHLENTLSGWIMHISQGYTTESRSNFQWRPLSEFSPYEPVIANLPPNTLKYYTDGSYGSTGQIGDRYPHGTTQVSCVFEIPLPLSVDGAVAVFDTTYLSSSGYTRQEWDELVAISKSLFPKTAQWKIDQELSALQEEFDDRYGQLAIQLEYMEEALEQVIAEEATISVDCWWWSWPNAIDNAWSFAAGQDAPWQHFNDGISATSAWSGTNPNAYENMMSCWAGTYWALNGYDYSSSDPYFVNIGSFETATLSHFSSWRDQTYDIYQQMADSIATSKFISGGVTSSYYSAQQIQYVREQLSSMCDDIRSNGYSALQNSANSLQALQAQYPTITCTVTIDPQTQQATSSYVQDENVWKRVIMGMNDQLARSAEEWFYESHDQLRNSYNYHDWETSWPEETKWGILSSISVNIDPHLESEWHDEYGRCLSSYTDYYRNERENISAQMEYISSEMSALSDWYDEEYERIMEIEDDPLPPISSVMKLTHYDLRPHADQLSSGWSAQLTLFAVCPDTDSEQLSDYPYWEYKTLQMDYMCDCPTTRWPYVRDVPTKYMVGLKKTALEEVSDNGTTQLSNVTKGRTWVYEPPVSMYSTAAFDDFRYNLMGYMEAGIAGNYFGLPDTRPQPRQLFGSQVNDPQRWNISADLSVDVGDISEGVLWMDYGEYNGTVRFGDEQWEHRDIYIQIVNGPLVFTDECWYLHKKRWESTSTVDWKYAEGEAEKVEYYAKEPIAGEDYDLPELSGHIEVNASEQVLGEFDTTYFMKHSSGF